MTGVQTCALPIFVEKPPLERAEAMLAEGGHYWNAGIFLASAKTWREELRHHEPGILEAAAEALEHAVSDGPVLRVDEEAFARSPAKRTDERRVVKAWVSRCGSRGWPAN